MGLSLLLRFTIFKGDNIVVFLVLLEFMWGFLYLIYVKRVLI